MRFMVGHCGKCLGKKMTGHYITANEHLMRGRPLRRRVVGADRPWLGDLASAVCRLVDASPGELRQLTG